MGVSNTHAGNKDSKVQCIEVWVSKLSVEKSGNNVQWTLSVYSLENQPVRKKSSESDEEIFHFMVYDWKRTIKHLLEDLQIPYSVKKYFAADTIFREAGKKMNFSEKAGELFGINQLADEVSSRVTISRPSCDEKPRS